MSNLNNKFLIENIIGDKYVVTLSEHAKKYWKYNENIINVDKNGNKVCSVPRCSNKFIAKALCSKHYQRLVLRGYILNAYDFIEDCRNSKGERICNVKNCNKKHSQYGYCAMHVWRLINSGCLDLEFLGEDGRKNKNPAYWCWVGMKTRCKNKNSINYDNYGGRGITVCERWEIFENFLEDMGERPSKKHSIDRINVNGDYEPINCRWANHYQQSHNKRKRGIENDHGVYKLKKKNKYRAEIAINGKRYYLGEYVKKSEAIKARKNAEEKYYPILFRKA